MIRFEERVEHVMNITEEKNKISLPFHTRTLQPTGYDVYVLLRISMTTTI